VDPQLKLYDANDRLALALAAATGLTVTRGGWECLEVYLDGAAPTEDDPHVLITSLHAPDLPVTSEGRYDDGLLVCAYRDSSGEPGVPLLTLGVADTLAADPAAIDRRLIDVLREWGADHGVTPATEPAEPVPALF
jgi:hypothetical protein